MSAAMGGLRGMDPQSRSGKQAVHCAFASVCVQRRRYALPLLDSSTDDVLVFIPFLMPLRFLLLYSFLLSFKIGEDIEHCLHALERDLDVLWMCIVIEA